MITFRNLSKLTLQQTYGRIGRFIKNKKKGWIIIPDVSLVTKELKDKILSFINYIKSINPGFDPTQHYDPTSLVHSPNLENIENLNDIDIRNRLFGELIEAIHIEVEPEPPKNSEELIKILKENNINYWDQYSELLNKGLLRENNININFEEYFTEKERKKVYNYLNNNYENELEELEIFRS